MLWLAGLFFLVLRAVSKKLPAKHKAISLIPFAFLALAVAALAYAPLPFGWGSIAGIVGFIAGWLLGLLGGLIGVSAAAIAGLILVAVLLFGGIDLIKDMKPDGWAKWMVYTTPVLVLIASSPIAAQVSDVLSVLGGVGPEMVASIT